MTKVQPDDLEAVRTVVEAVAGFERADQERIVRWACEKLGLAAQPLPGSQPIPTGGQPQTVEDAPAVRGRASPDIKSFVDAKNPSSDNQFAAAVAYYYRFEAPEHLRKDSIKAEDLQEACRQVGRDRLGRPAQTLVNAHGQGLLDRGERGAYTINTVGENLVAMALPAASGRVAPKVSRKRPAVSQPRARQTKVAKRR